MLRLREQSELTLNGEGIRVAMIRAPHLTKGSVGFDVKKQNEGSAFRLTSPTSVASIRGTKGKWGGGEGVTGTARRSSIRAILRLRA